MKSVLIMALGATLAATAGSAFAEDQSTAGSPTVTTTRVSLVEGERWGGSSATVYDRNCECNVPVVNVPFYTVRPPAPPIRVRAPGLRISSAPVFAPSPAIYIQGPPIYVDAPPVQVAPAQVYLEAPDVHVRPSEVSVAPPEIHFTPAGPEHPDEHCCDVASPPAYSGNMAPPADTGYAAPAAVPASTGYVAPASYPAPASSYPAPAATGSSSGYAQEPGERG